MAMKAPARKVVLTCAVTGNAPFNRSHPAFQIVPVDETELPRTPLEGDSLYGARAVGRSDDGHTAAEHDTVGVRVWRM